jgi:Uma2 family endonuclease
MPYLVDHRVFFDRELTWNDLQAIPDDTDGARDGLWMYELIEGTLMVRPRPRDLRHQSCLGSLAILLHRVCPVGLQVIAGAMAFTPEAGYVLLPDVMLARTPVLDLRLEQAPMLVVEVISPETRLADTNLKPGVYEEHGVEHYWIVDPAGPSIQALRLVDGRYRVVAGATGAETFQVSEPVPMSFEPRALLDA